DADGASGAELDRARLEGIGRTVVGGPVTALGDITVTGDRTADGRALRVGGAGGAAPRAELGHVADTGRGAALGCARLEGVGRTVGGRAGAGLGEVAGTCCRAAVGRARMVGVGWTVVLGSVAGRGGVTVLGVRAG